MVRTLAALVLLVGLVGCTGDERSADPPSPTATATELDEDLREQLVRMAAQDQGQQTGGEQLTADERVALLKQIIAEHGWPTYDLVGRDGEDAAWLIAQHADLDPEFQAEALELLRAAVEEDQASPGNLAYLEDRVAVANGQPQRYGTQVGCTRSGPKPSTPIDDPAGLDARREVAGIPPYHRYVKQMTRICQQ